MMKRKLIVDVDSERKKSIIIGPIKEHPNQEMKPDPILDMAVLCEAVVTMIHLCHQENIKKDADSLRDCIKHLKDGFVEAGYKCYIPDEAKEEITLREAIENKLNQQVIILGSNVTHVFGLTFNNLGKMEYFTCDASDFGETNKVGTINKHPFKKHCDFIYPGGDIFVTGYYGNRDVNETEWKR